MEAKLKKPVQGRSDATNSMEISQRKSKLSAIARDIDSAFSSSLDKMASKSHCLSVPYCQGHQEQSYADSI